MAAASFEVSVQPPDLAAAVCLVGAVVAIDLWALRVKRSTVSKFIRHQAHEHPVATAVAAALLGLHLLLEFDGDPFGLVARRFAQ